MWSGEEKPSTPPPSPLTSFGSTDPADPEVVAAAACSPVELHYLSTRHRHCVVPVMIGAARPAQHQCGPESMIRVNPIPGIRLPQAWRARPEKRTVRCRAARGPVDAAVK